jgi:hypothetical protein
MHLDFFYEDIAPFTFYQVLSVLFNDFFFFSYNTDALEGFTSENHKSLNTGKKKLIDLDFGESYSNFFPSN